MKLLATLALAGGVVVLATAGASAAGVDELDPAVAKRLYNPAMLDPAQPIGPSAYRNFKAILRSLATELTASADDTTSPGSAASFQ